MVRVLGHRQTKGAATDPPRLMPPRHISTLQIYVIELCDRMWPGSGHDVDSLRQQRYVPLRITVRRISPSLRSIGHFRKYASVLRKAKEENGAL